MTKRLFDMTVPRQVVNKEKSIVIDVPSPTSIENVYVLFGAIQVALNEKDDMSFVLPFGHISWAIPGTRIFKRFTEVYKAKN